MVATKLSTDGTSLYYAQIMEFNADVEVGYTAAPRSSTTSSSDFDAIHASEKAIDYDYSTFWASVGHTSAANTEYLVLDMGAVTNNVGRVKITSVECCFPEDFKLQYSTDGITYTDVLGQSYTGYPQPGRDSVRVFNFVAPVNARYIRLYATKLRPDSYNNYYAQIMEFRAYIKN
jgi:hypothetical protein